MRRFSLRNSLSDEDKENGPARAPRRRSSLMNILNAGALSLREAQKKNSSSDEDPYSPDRSALASAIEALERARETGMLDGGRAADLSPTGEQMLLASRASNADVASEAPMVYIQSAGSRDICVHSPVDAYPREVQRTSSASGTDSPALATPKIAIRGGSSSSAEAATPAWLPVAPPSRVDPPSGGRSTPGRYNISVEVNPEHPDTLYYSFAVFGGAANGLHDPIVAEHSARYREWRRLYEGLPASIRAAIRAPFPPKRWHLALCKEAYALAHCACHACEPRTRS